MKLSKDHLGKLLYASEWERRYFWLDGKDKLSHACINAFKSRFSSNDYLYENLLCHLSISLSWCYVVEVSI